MFGLVTLPRLSACLPHTLHSCPQGGASTQFSAIPLNLAGEGDTVDYIVTGSWSKKAASGARLCWLLSWLVAVQGCSQLGPAMWSLMLLHFVPCCCMLLHAHSPAVPPLSFARGQEVLQGERGGHGRQQVHPRPRLLEPVC